MIIDAMRDPNGSVAQAISNHLAKGAGLFTSTIVRFELEIGARKSAHPELGLAVVNRFLGKTLTILDFDQHAIKLASLLFPEAKRDGQNLQAYDVLIAGHAMALGAKSLPQSPSPAITIPTTNHAQGSCTHENRHHRNVWD